MLMVTPDLLRVALDINIYTRNIVEIGNLLI